MNLKYVSMTVVVVLIVALLAYIQYHNDEKKLSLPFISKIKALTGQGLDTPKIDDGLYRYLKRPNPYQPVKNPDVKYSQAHQDEVVYEIFPKEGGFYIEMGAFNGVQLSNTLWLERRHRWTGLLIEANPSLCKQIDAVKRSAWRLCACISTEKEVTFIPGRALGGVKDTIDSDHMKAVNKKLEITVPCFTLGRVLDEINVHKIDFFSLDVEGAEMFILGTIKEELKTGKIVVGVWSIEYRVYDGKKNIYDKSKNNLEKLRRYFKEVGGYFEHSQLDQVPRSKVQPDGYGLDVVFVNTKIWCENHTEIPNGGKC